MARHLQARGFIRASPQSTLGFHRPSRHLLLVRPSNSASVKNDFSLVLIFSFLSLKLRKDHFNQKTVPSMTSISPYQANSTDPSHTKAEAGEYLAFRLGTEAYGIGILGVQEIRFYEKPTQIAGAPPHVRGILDLRGVSVPVVDLRVCLGLDAHFNSSTVTVVINLPGHQTIGAVVDSVSDVVALAKDQIRNMPSMGEYGEARHVTGLACISQESSELTLLLIDIPQLMARAQVAGAVTH
ncbi:chemotaxis signal transduction protein [Acidovorax sp. CF316]|nr:chemotaxis signal transduction protein [Acidovorax sp. CF316]